MPCVPRWARVHAHECTCAYARVHACMRASARANVRVMGSQSCSGQTACFLEGFRDYVPVSSNRKKYDRSGSTTTHTSSIAPMKAACRRMPLRARKCRHAPPASGKPASTQRLVIGPGLGGDVSSAFKGGGMRLLSTRLISTTLVATSTYTLVLVEKFCACFQRLFFAPSGCGSGQTRFKSSLAPNSTPNYFLSTRNNTRQLTTININA